MRVCVCVPKFGCQLSQYNVSSICGSVSNKNLKLVLLLLIQLYPRHEFIEVSHNV